MHKGNDLGSLTYIQSIIEIWIILGTRFLVWLLFKVVIIAACPTLHAYFINSSTCNISRTYVQSNYKCTDCFTSFTIQATLASEQCSGSWALRLTHNQCRCSSQDLQICLVPMCIDWHISVLLQSFPLLNACFKHVLTDIVGSLSPSQRSTYLLTCIDWYTRWPGAVQIPNTRADTIAKAFVSGWVACFECLSVVMTDQGRQAGTLVLQCFKFAYFCPKSGKLGTSNAVASAFWNCLETHTVLHSCKMPEPRKHKQQVSSGHKNYGKYLKLKPKLRC